jgi:lipopolysaccharide export LptBFGC system permease protein LptF
LGLFFAYWFVLQVSIRAGEASYIPPILAAWTANLFFGLLGFCGYTTLR